jgi:hypothetical protein
MIAVDSRCFFLKINGIPWKRGAALYTKTFLLPIFPQNKSNPVLKNTGSAPVRERLEISFQITYILANVSTYYFIVKGKTYHLNPK